ncbi:MAG: hypothetical protein LBU42_03845 [Prevotellaceae bacterium]|jgi:hypothetical protein|nr:hypothetical protein [Prevotellaceae bacterium]
MKRIVKIAGHVLLHAAALAGFGAAVMLLWNGLMPAIFGLTAIGFWQALGLLALARVLFGGAGHHRWAGGWARRHHSPVREKWQKMTPEERKEFVKNHFRHHFGHDFYQTGQPETTE